MDVEYLLGSMLRGVLTSRSHRKRATGAMRFLVGNRRAGGGALLLGGLAYALFESLTKGSEANTGANPLPLPSTGPVASARAPASTTVVPPPLPTAAAPPPIPSTAQAGAAVAPIVHGEDAVGDVPAEVLRVIRLSISAACADGALTERERDAILTQARAARAEHLVAADFRDPPAVRDVLAGFKDAALARQLYTIAFAIVRADEDVSVKEREYLREVASVLVLNDDVIAEIERDAAARIERSASEI